jgi:hypothetical protein
MCKHQGSHQGIWGGDFVCLSVCLSPPPLYVASATLMFGAEERVDEECERIAEEIALEIMDLRNFLPPASRWRAKEKGLLSQVHQVEKFLIQSYVDDEEDAKLILQKIHEVEKLPKEEQRQAIQSRKQNLLKEKEKEMNSKMEEKERKLRLYLPQGKKRLIDLNDDILS